VTPSGAFITWSQCNARKKKGRRGGRGGKRTRDRGGRIRLEGNVGGPPIRGKERKGEDTGRQMGGKSRDVKSYTKIIESFRGKKKKGGK